jgi:hypothetical protein
MLNLEVVRMHSCLKSIDSMGVLKGPDSVLSPGCLERIGGW